MGEPLKPRSAFAILDGKEVGISKKKNLHWISCYLNIANSIEPCIFNPSIFQSHEHYFSLATVELMLRIQTNQKIWRTVCSLGISAFRFSDLRLQVLPQNLHLREVSTYTEFPSDVELSDQNVDVWKYFLVYGHIFQYSSTFQALRTGGGSSNGDRVGKRW